MQLCDLVVFQVDVLDVLPGRGLVGHICDGVVLRRHVFDVRPVAHSAAQTRELVYVQVDPLDLAQLARCLRKLSVEKVLRQVQPRQLLQARQRGEEFVTIEEIVLAQIHLREALQVWQNERQVWEIAHTHRHERQCRQLLLGRLLNQMRRHVLKNVLHLHCPSIHVSHARAQHLGAVL